MDTAPCCIICHQSKPAPIHSGCGCKSDGGLAHSTCRAQWAVEAGGEAWSVCTVCKQQFTGEMFRELAAARFERVSEVAGVPPAVRRIWSPPPVDLCWVWHAQMKCSCDQCDAADDHERLDAANLQAHALSRAGRHAEAEALRTEVSQRSMPVSDATLAPFAFSDKLERMPRH